MDKIKRELIFRDALRLFGSVDVAEIKALVRKLIATGTYYDFEILEVIDAKTREDLLLGFDKILKKAGLTPYGSKDDAVWFILRYHMQNIVSEVSDPIDALNELIEFVYANSELFEKTTNYVGDSHGLESFVSYYWFLKDTFEDLQDPKLNMEAYGIESLKDLKKRIYSTAKEWLDKYPGP